MPQMALDTISPLPSKYTYFKIPPTNIWNKSYLYTTHFHAKTYINIL